MLSLRAGFRRRDIDASKTNKIDIFGSHVLYFSIVNYTFFAASEKLQLFRPLIYNARCQRSIKYITLDRRAWLGETAQKRNRKSGENVQKANSLVGRFRCGLLLGAERDISRWAPFSKWPALVALGVDRAAVTFTTYADPERDVRGG